MKKAIVGNTVVFTFTPENGVAIPPVIFDPAKAHPDNQAYAVAFGFSHRLGDNAALSRTMPDGTVRNITEAMRHEAVVGLAAHYESGSPEWDVRTAGVKRAPPQNPTWLAIAAKRGVAYDVVAAEKVAADLAELAGM